MDHCGMLSKFFRIQRVGKYYVLFSTIMCQLVHGSTHRSGHTLDLVIIRESDSFLLIKDVVNKQLSGHFRVDMVINITKPEHLIQTITYRKTRKHKY